MGAARRQPVGQGYSYLRVRQRVRNALNHAAQVEKLRENEVQVYLPFSWRLAARLVVALLFRWLIRLSIIVTIIVVIGDLVRGGAGATILCVMTLFASILYWLWVRNAGLAAYREMCFAAYHGALAKVTGSNILRAQSIDSNSIAAVSDWLRLKDARRWARFYTFVELASLLAMTFTVCALVLWEFWNSNLIHTSYATAKTSDIAVSIRVLGGSFEEVTWNLANSIPVLDLPSALHWAEPTSYADGLIVRVTLLIMRVAAFGPIIAWIITTSRQNSFDPRNRPNKDPVINALIVGLAVMDKPGYSVTARWRMAGDHASRMLGPQYPPASVWEYISTITVKSIYS